MYDYRVTRMDYSISLSGISTAERSLDQSARRIAAAKPTTDYAAEAVNIDRASIAEKANLRVISIQQELDGSILDLFA